MPPVPPMPPVPLPQEAVDKALQEAPVVAAAPAGAARAEWGSNDAHALLNHDIPRVDGPDKVTGVARYTHDMRVPGMLTARLLLCPWPRARIQESNYRRARRVPGVVHAEPLKPDGSELLYQGDESVVGVVVGETPEAADAGLAEVSIDYELREPLVTPEQALAPGAPGLGRGGKNTGGENSSGDAEAVEEALAGCDLVVEATYALPVQHHVSLETHGVVVDFRGGDEATVYHSSQAVTGSNAEFAGYLGLPEEKVTVIAEHVGGGFGAKFGAGLEGKIACELAAALKRPVHLMLRRGQEFQMAGNRSGSVQRMRAGANKDGSFVALSVDADRLGGMGLGALPTPPYIYTVQHSHAVVRAVHTATDSSRAMRAPGHPQASFAMESLIDELAYGLSLDPLVFRIKNLADPVHHRQLERVAHEIGWFEHAHRTAPGVPVDGRAFGIGFGVSIWGSRSMPRTVVEVRIEPGGAVTASTGVQDIGQGARTLVAAIVAEELGLPATAVRAHIGSTRLPPASFSGGSVTTGSIGPSIKDAAWKARLALAERLAPVLGAEPGALRFAGGRVFVASAAAADGAAEAPDGDAARSLSWEQATATLGKDPLVVNGVFQAHLRDEGVHGAQAASVEVDLLTGRVRVLKMVAIQDQGLPLNRLAIRSQMQGGMIQALSYALLEERVHDEQRGLLLSGDMENYKLAGCEEMPEFVALIDDDDTRQAVMGMAEASIIPGHSAIGNAIYNACGLRLRRTPFTPDRVLAALRGTT